MKHLLCAFLLILASCSGKAPQEVVNDDYDVIGESFAASENIEPDTIPPFTISKSKSSGYNVWTIKENPRKVSDLSCGYEVCPSGLYDRPASRQLKREEPVYYKDATWSAACRALKNLVPNPEARIIYNFAKLNRQINNSEECLYTGECEIKNINGKYVPAEINIMVRWSVPNDFREASGWYCTGTVVF